MKIQRKYIWWSLSAVLLIVMIIMMSWPDPVSIEVATAEIGPLRSTIDEEGVTRVHERFLLTAPVTGRLRRVMMDEGDTVTRGQVLIHLSPAPLDVRAQAQAQARIEAAEALRQEAQAQVESAQANLREAQRQQARAESLAVNDLMSTEQRDLARLQTETMTKALEAAEFRARAAEFEVEVARTALLASTPSASSTDAECIEVTSPVTGSILRVFEENERIVPAGTPLLELGDPASLEIVVDLLSTDAVKVWPGARMWIEDWGGDTALAAVVRLIEPSGFTKTSALGVEEQRVNVIADLVDSHPRLGDGYRVETRIVLWESDAVLNIPWSALVRRGVDWGVYVIEEGRARWRDVEVGHRGATAVEITSGIEPGEDVIMHPSDRIEAEVRVTPSAR